MSLFGSLFQSVGLKRTLSVVFYLASEIVSAVPQLAAYGPILQTVGTVLGVTGLAHAGLSLAIDQGQAK